MERAHIVTFNLSNAIKEKNRPTEELRALEELNRSLANGWKVKAISPFGGTEHGFLTAALVVVEKE